MKQLLFFFFAFIFFSALSQSKIEKETRISGDQFPENSLEILHPYLKKAKRTRLYKEFDGENISYEAKFKFNNRWHSIEFNSDGQLEDVEIIIEFTEIPEEIQNSILSDLSGNFKKFKINKVQYQYPALEEDPKKVLSDSFSFQKKSINNYELVVSVKTKSGYEYQERLYNSIGSLLSSKTIVNPSYEHILY